MTEYTHITTPMDPLRWLEACDIYRKSLTDPIKQAAFHDHRFELWPFLLGRDGRLHPTWSPTAWTSRISAKGPPLQQIPKPLRVGIQSPNKLIITADWRGSHLRLLAHYSGDKVLTADLAGDVYAVLADFLVGSGIPKKNARKAAKKALLTKLNGGGTELLRQILVDYGAPRSIDMSEFDAHIIRRWTVAFRHFGNIVQATERAGWKITTPFGAEVAVPEDKRNPHHIVAGWLQAVESEALRRVVGYAKRQERANGSLHLVALVHDETVWEADPDIADRAMKLVEKLMNVAMFPQGSTLAGSATDVNIGPSWGQQDGTRNPPTGEVKAPTAWARRGVEAVVAASHGSPVKGAVHAVLSEPESRFAVEMARLHAHGDLAAAVGLVKATTGGREAASALSSLIKRVDATVAPYLSHTTAKANTVIGFERGDHIELAQRLLCDIGGLDADGDDTGCVIADRGALWSVQDDGLWSSHGASEVRAKVQSYAGMPVGPKRIPMRLSYGDTVSTYKTAMDKLATEDHFDGQVEGVPFTNGLLLPDGTFREYEADDRVMSDQVLPIAYCSTATCPRWDRFLREVYDGEPDIDARIQVLREFVGAALFGVSTRYQKALFLVGDGSNGKSVLLDTVRSLFNPASVVSLPPQQLSGSKSEYYAAQLATARINIVTELPERDLMESETVKAAITGDVISGRDPCERPFSFKPFAAWVIAANRLPAVRDSSHGFWRRPLILTHNRVFTEGVDADPLLSGKLHQELAGIATWAVVGALGLIERGHYPVLPSSQDAVVAWRDDADSVASFAAEHLEEAQDSRMGALRLYHMYRDWCRDHGCRPSKSNNFAKRLQAAGFDRRRDSRGRFYEVHLVNDWRFEDEQPDIGGLLDDEDDGCLSLVVGK